MNSKNMLQSDTDEKCLFIKSIAVIIVVYKVNVLETPAFNSLKKSALKFFESCDLEFSVFDNSPTTAYNDEEKLQKCKIGYKYNSSNPGLSLPSNEGAIIASENRKKWLLFTNPDTEFPIEYFEKLYLATNENPQIKLFAPVLVSNSKIVSPANFYFYRGSSPSNITSGINNLRKKIILYSGLFVEEDAFQRVGGFNNRIKLDFMDNYFTDKYKEKYGIFYLLDVKCIHDLSSNEKDVNKVLNRFKYYCEGAKLYGEFKSAKTALMFICFLRSLKLAVTYRKPTFIKIVFNSFM